MQTKRLAIIALASSLALVLAFAYAHVLTYYPVSVTLKPTSPKVIFAPGGNANSPDISNNIVVNVGDNQTSLAITVHPSYETTWYRNISLIVNSDTKAYSVSIVVSQSIQGLPAGSEAYLLVYKKGASRSFTDWPVPTPGGYIKRIDLTQSTTSPISVGSMNGGDVWEIDLFIYIPEGSALQQSYTAKLYLVASPS